MIIAFPDPRRRGRLRWMTLDEAEVHMAELAVQVAYGRMLLLKLQQFCKQQTHGEVRP